MTITDAFIANYIDDPEDIDGYLRDAFGLIHGEAQERGIEFDGYFNTKWKESADTIGDFDEAYFADVDRRNLYVWKAAEVNPEIFALLQQAYEIAHLQVPTMNDIHQQIFELEEKGVKF